MSPEQVHGILAEQFTDVYIKRQHLGLLAFSAPYQPGTDPFCDYDKTWWEAKPTKWSPHVGPPIVSAINRMLPRTFKSLFVDPLTAMAPDITDSLHEYPVAFINGHTLDLQAALPLVAGSIGIARAGSEEDYQKNLEDMIKISHAIANRGFAPIRIRRPWLPASFAFLDLGRLVVNPHLSFPRNKRMAESDIPESFLHDYNTKLKDECIEIAGAPTEHPLGFKTLWSLAPGGTPDVKIKDDGHVKEIIIKRVEPATIHLIERMGCALLPVNMSFRKYNEKSRTVAEFGSIIPPDEVTDSTIHELMEKQAEYRRDHGEPVLYEEEPAV